MTKQILEQFLLNPLMCSSPLHFAPHTHACARTITHITGTFKITTIKVWKFNQTTLFNDSLITLISYMHTQHYACVVTRRHFSLDNITHITNIWMLTNYACFNVSSDWADQYMACYKHLKRKGGHHYVCVDVF